MHSGAEEAARGHLPLAKPGAWGQSFQTTFKAMVHMNSIKAGSGGPETHPFGLIPLPTTVSPEAPGLL